MLFRSLQELPFDERREFAFTWRFGLISATGKLTQLQSVASGWEPELIVYETADLAAPIGTPILAPGKAMVGSTATVEVTPKQAEIIALSGYIAAYYSGNLSLSLKSLMAADSEAPPSAAGISAAKPNGDSASSSMSDSDISKLLPHRKTAAQHFGSLTILRRSSAEEANGS